MKNNQLKIALIIGCSVISILLAVVCIYHFYFFIKMLEAIDALKRYEESVSIYTWQAVGNFFAAVSDLIFIAFAWFTASIISKHHKTILETNEQLIELNKKNCPKCGTEVDKESQFCPKCGENLFEEKNKN